MSGHFVSDFPDSGSVDYSDQSTNLDETAIAELKELAGHYPQPTTRSEERRVGKECRSRWSPYH